MSKFRYFIKDDNRGILKVHGTKRFGSPALYGGVLWAGDDYYEAIVMLRKLNTKRRA